MLCAGLLVDGPTGMAFLKLGVGARPMAMAGAFTAVADDANALFWNPAGLAMTRGYAANVTFMNLYRSAGYASGGLTVPLGRRCGAGFAGGRLAATDTRRSPQGQELGTFTVADFVAGPGFAWRPIRSLAVGVGCRYVSSRIDSFTARTVSFDGGLMYRPVPFVSLGASVLHLGPPRRFIELDEYQPVDLRAGGALRLPLTDGHLLLSADVSAGPDRAAVAAFGGEMYYRLGDCDTTAAQGWYVRAGYRTGFHAGSWSGWSLGMGYEYGVSRCLAFGIDAVYVSYGLLGGSERVSVFFRFVPGLFWRELPER